MLKPIIALIALLAAMPLAAQTPAAPPATARIATTRTEDLRCLLLASELVGTGNAEQKDAGTKAALYYAGKLLGREPNLDLSAVSKIEIVAMATLDREAGLRRCGTELQLTGGKLQAAGAALSELAKRDK